MIDPFVVPERMYDDDVQFSIGEPARALDFDYELRHPGHGDQSVHNPHKHGGNGAAVASDLAAGRDVVVAGRDLPGAFDAMANGDGGVNLNRLSTTDGVSFAATGVKVPRSEMPQVPGSKKAEFIAELDGKGVKSTRESVDPKSLKPIQSEISGQKSGQMLQSMREGKLLEGDNPLIVSRDGFVVDGHHRWAAAVARSYEVPVALPVLRIDMDAAQLLGEVKAFSEAQSIPARVFDRAVDFHYELRHPGHPDQSVHNPHKGMAGAGAPYKSGAWKPVTREQLDNMDRAVYRDLMTRRGEHVADRVYSEYKKERAHGDTYVNGTVVVRFPDKKLTPAEQKAVLKDIDHASQFVPEGMLDDPRFPIEVNIRAIGGRKAGQWSNSLEKDGGVMALNTKDMKSRSYNDPELSYRINTMPDSIFPKSVPWHPKGKFKDDAQHTVVHEFGHVTAQWSYRTGKGGANTAFNDISFKGKGGYISKYAAKNHSERYAEHFSAWAGGATDAMTAELAQLHGWKRP